MPAGKLSAQAGHAYCDAYADCIEKMPHLVERYRRGDNGGSKATLNAKNQFALERLARECEQAGIPHAVVFDKDHILLPHFDGSRIMTAVGVGPISRREGRAFVKRFQAVK